MGKTIGVWQDVCGEAKLYRQRIGMVLYGGRAYGFGYAMYFYKMKDGVLCREELSEEQRGPYYMKPGTFKFNFGKEFAGNGNFFVNWETRLFGKLLNECLGKTDGEIRTVVDGIREGRDKRYAEELRKKSEWAVLQDKFGGVVIGLGREVDKYDVGFSVRVLMRSDSSFEERRDFVKGNRKELLLWVMRTLQRDKRVGDINYYKPVELTVLGIPEVDIKFELKSVVCLDA